MDNHNERPQEPYLPQKRVDPDHTFATAPHYGGFWMRVWAYLFDLLVIAAVNGLIIYPVFKLMGLNESIGIISPAGIASTFVYFAYFVFMTKFFSQTLGKMVFGLKVVSLKGKPLSWPIVLFRELIGRYIHTAITIFTVPILMVLFLVVAFTPKKQGIHDLIADTSVIHERTVLALVKPAIN